MAEKIVTISVRHLVEFILRSGDIDSRSGNLIEMDAMQQGNKMHRRLQKAAGPSYKAEVMLKHQTLLEDGIYICVEGRADGIITESEMAVDETGMLSLQEIVTIDEIKGTYKDVGHIMEPVPVHLAQAMCYAYFYAVSENLKKIKVRMTYVHLETAKIKYLEENYYTSELEVWYTELIEKYAMWIRWERDWQQQRNLAIQDMKFPFPYRESQKQLIKGIYQTILRRKRLFAQAPTGTGKTLAAIYPAVQTLGTGQTEKIFYLTARTIARTVAEDSLELLRSKGLMLKAITLTARDKICIFDEANCHPGICPRAKGHFDRVNEAIFDMLTHESHITADCVSEYASRHQVCPFEFQLDVALWMDMIICDYNYVFDPDVALKRFFADRGGEYVYLIDEAHNLVERARDMYSAQLSLQQFKEVLPVIKGFDQTLSRRINDCIRSLEGSYQLSAEPFEVIETAGVLMVYLEKLNDFLEKLLKKEIHVTIRERMTELYFEIRHFIQAYDRMTKRYVTYLIREKNNLTVRIYCIDPSKDLSERLVIGRSAIFFSATLLPVGYYKDMLSDSAKEDYDLGVSSPFDRQNCLVLSAGDVSSRYSRRSYREYEKIAFYIRQIIRGRYGNYMVFFPSYQMLSDVFEVFREKELSLAGHGLHIVVQEPVMDEAKRQAFLDTFKQKNQATVGFCVLGGIFSEGIDLKEDQLIGAIIVGTGLPQIGFERELLRYYFDMLYQKGFEYAYVYPGMNKVLQAGGRVIRTQKDKGVIALLDDRFMQEQYRRLFPEEWHHCIRTDLSMIESQIENFWTKNEKE